MAPPFFDGAGRAAITPEHVLAGIGRFKSGLLSARRRPEEVPAETAIDAAVAASLLRRAAGGADFVETNGLCRDAFIAGTIRFVPLLMGVFFTACQTQMEKVIRMGAASSALADDPDSIGSADVLE